MSVIKGMEKKKKRILIVTAVKAEKEAIENGLDPGLPIDICVGGVGPIASATQTAIQLAQRKYSLVANLGIAGGFAPHAEIGSLVVSTEIVAADLGIETAQGFTSLQKTGMGVSSISAHSQWIARCTQKLTRAGLSVVTGPVLTVSTTTGTETTKQELCNRYPDAVAEGMEGFGVATAANAYHIPIIEIRSISNRVGPRDRSSWKIKEALQLLTKSSSILFKEREEL